MARARYRYMGRLRYGTGGSGRGGWLQMPLVCALGNGYVMSQEAPKHFRNSSQGSPRSNTGFVNASPVRSWQARQGACLGG